MHQHGLNGCVGPSHFPLHLFVLASTNDCVVLVPFKLKQVNMFHRILQSTRWQQHRCCCVTLHCWFTLRNKSLHVSNSRGESCALSNAGPSTQRPLVSRATWYQCRRNLLFIPPNHWQWEEEIARLVLYRSRRWSTCQAGHLFQPNIFIYLFIHSKVAHLPVLGHSSLFWKFYKVGSAGV